MFPEQTENTKLGYAQATVWGSILFLLFIPDTPPGNLMAVLAVMSLLCSCRGFLLDHRIKKKTQRWRDQMEMIELFKSAGAGTNNTITGPFTGTAVMGGQFHGGVHVSSSISER
ncbi:hypothetical protein ABZ635_23095 [Nocardiopsis sp. NPDC007018]|uniref:hypothetical protein n=1 Tax=Nocardiopsis sp. NPDC007018 TaxID=3155721 RepID=UPI003400EF96